MSFKNHFFPAKIKNKSKIGGFNLLNRLIYYYYKLEKLNTMDKLKKYCKILDHII